MAGVHIGGEPGDRVVVGDIQRAVLRDLGSRRPGLGHGPGQSLSVDVGQIQLRTRAGKPQRRGAADATGRTGHQDPPTREVVPHSSA